MKKVWISFVFLLLVGLSDMKPFDDKSKQGSIMDSKLNGGLKQKPKYWISKGRIRVSKVKKSTDKTEVEKTTEKSAFKKPTDETVAVKLTSKQVKKDTNLADLTWKSRNEIKCDLQRSKPEVRVLHSDRMAVDNTLTISEDVTNSKLDKLLNMMTENWDTYMWEKSMLTEIAQTLSYLFTELRQQEKHVKRLNRNVRNSLKVLFDGQDINQILKNKSG